MHGGTSAMGLQLTPHRRRAPGGVVPIRARCHRPRSPARPRRAV